MKKLKQILNKIKYEAVIMAMLFLVIALHFYIENDLLNMRSILFLLDYKVGFASRLLIGSIINIFVDNYTQALIDVINIGVLIFTALVISLLLARLVRRIEKQQRSFFLILIAILIFAPSGLKIIATQRGLLDIYWIIFTLFAVISLRSEKLKWLVPVFCFLGLANHYAFLFAFLPTIFAIIIYEIYKRPSKNNIRIGSVSLGLSAVSTVYFAFFANKLLLMNRDEVYSYVLGKMDLKIIWEDYIDAYFFNMHRGYEVEGIKEYLTVLFEFNLQLMPLGKILTTFLSAFLLLVFFALVFGISSKKAKDGWQKRIFLLNMILPIAALPSFILSPDFERWISYIIITQFLVLFYYIYDKNEIILSSIESIKNCLLKHPYVYIAVAFLLVKIIPDILVFFNLRYF